jgi:hypothetical protein
MLNVQPRRGALLPVILASACNSGRSSMPTAATQSPTTAAFATLVGSYALTVEIDPACTALPEAERIRRYDAIVVDTNWDAPPVRPIDIRGNGFSDSTLIGELWWDGDSKFRLQWNNFDIGGCDIPEPLGDSKQLLICGTGSATVNRSIISTSIHGHVCVTSGAQPPHCANTLIQFTFVSTEDSVAQLPGQAIDGEPNVCSGHLTRNGRELCFD